MKETPLRIVASSAFQKDDAVNCLRMCFPSIQIHCGDITKLNVDGFVFYTNRDLQLGSGFGGMIRGRGGSDIQKQLNALAPRNVTEAVLTSGGRLDIDFIAHAVGPELGEPQRTLKLERTILNALELCESRKATHIAVPTMGTGYYGIPIETCASTTFKAFKTFFKRVRHLLTLTICCRDRWELPALENAFRNSPFYQGS